MNSIYLAGDKVNVMKLENGVNEAQKSFLTVRSVGKPSSVVKQRKWSLGFGVIFQKVAGQHDLNGLGIFLVLTTIGHWAWSAMETTQLIHGNFPAIKSYISFASKPIFNINFQK